MFDRILTEHASQNGAKRRPRACNLDHGSAPKAPKIVHGPFFSKKSASGPEFDQKSDPGSQTIVNKWMNKRERLHKKKQANQSSQTHQSSQTNQSGQTN